MVGTTEVKVANQHCKCSTIHKEEKNRMLRIRPTSSAFQGVKDIKLSLLYNYTLKYPTLITMLPNLIQSCISSQSSFQMISLAMLFSIAVPHKQVLIQAMEGCQSWMRTVIVIMKLPLKQVIHNSFSVFSNV